MDALARECAVFCRHLIGQRPSEYVTAKYREYHQLPAARQELQAGALDRTLLAVAGLHPCTTQLADGFARIFRPASVLRKKLILLLAILETCAPFSDDIAAVPPGWRALVYVRLFLALAVAGIVLVASTALFLPWHLLAMVARKPLTPRPPCRSTGVPPVSDTGETPVLRQGEGERKPEAPVRAHHA